VMYTDKPYTAEWLKRTFGASLVSGADAANVADVQIILGANWQVPTP